MLRRLDGFAVIIAATVIAGVAGYAVTWLVYRQAGPVDYAIFAVFWAAIYLVIGAISGVQQEITRATVPIEFGSSTRASRARNFAVVTSVGVFAVVVASAVFWADTVFPTEGWALVWPLAVGTGAYVLVAVLCGSLYGLSHWRSLALLIAADGLLRLSMLAVALVFTRDIVVLAWVVALPFPLTIILLWPLIRRGFVGRTTLDVGYRALSWNVARTVFAAASTAVLVSGFPLLLGVAAAGVERALVGELIFTITLTRAPLIVSVMALQSYFVVRFKQDAGWRPFLGVQAIIAVGAVLLAVAGWWLGPAVFTWVSGAPFSLSGELIAVLVASSALVAMVSVSASAVLARSNHAVYTIGWLVAAVVTIVIILGPGDFLVRVGWALIAGPIAGLVVHGAWLAWSSRSASRA